MCALRWLPNLLSLPDRSSKPKARRKTARRSPFLFSPGTLASGPRGLERRKSMSIEPLEQRQLLTTLAVTNLNDSSSFTAGDGSLRGEIAAAASGDTVQFAAGLTGTIDLTDGPLVLNQDLSIVGAGGGVTVSGKGQSTVFEVDAGATVSMAGLTVSGGFSPSTDLYNAGGIYNAGTLTLTDCTLSNNQGAVSALYNDSGTLTLLNSTVADNLAEGSGAIWNNLGTVALTNSTVADNNDAAGTSSDVGISAKHGLSLTLANTIVFGNGTDIVGPVTANHSLIGNTAGATISGANNLLSVNPDLGPLADNGGPTQTLALLVGSPAIDTGNNALAVDGAGNALATDQRGPGYARVVGPNVDIGAYEFNHTVVVSTTSDENDGNYSFGHLSLREAVELADANSTVNGITFDPTVFATAQTITLTGGQMELSAANVAITAPTAGLTIDANNSSRVFQIDAGAAATLTGLTLVNGTTGGDGGAILNDGGTLSLANSSLESAVASGNGGALANENGGAATISNSQIEQNSASGNGGGIYNDATSTLTVSGGTFAVNVNGGGQGAGIDSAGATTLLNSVVDDGLQVAGGSLGAVNTTIATLNAFNMVIDGTGIELSAGSLKLTDSTVNAGGTGINISAGSAILTNSTVAAAGTGVYLSGGSATLTDSTVAKGGTGIDNSGGTVALANTIVGQNSSDVIGQVTANYSLIGDTAGATIGGANNVLNVNPDLGPLANNGGPTQTFAFAAASPAIGAGSVPLAVDPNGNPLTTDQRGAPYARVSGGQVDIGAFEHYNVHAVVSTIADENDGNYSSGHLSLREAIQLVDQNVGGFNNTITFDTTVFATPQTIDLTQGTPLLTAEATITAPAAGVTIDSSQGRDLQIGTPSNGRPSTVTLDGLTISGGGIVNYATLIVSGCTLTDNTNGNVGGAILNASFNGAGGTLTVSDSSFSGNSALGGGAIENSESASLTVSGGSFTGNSASGAGAGGGAIENAGSPLSVADSTFTGNSAVNVGGAISTYGGTVSGSTFDNNSAGGEGGGIVNYATLSLSGSTFSGNSANLGGGIAFEGTTTVSACTFDGNTAASYGGGVYNHASATLTGGTLSDNHGGTGGAIDNMGNLTLTQVTLTGNSAAVGGAIDSVGHATVDHSTLTSNRASSEGGAVDVEIGGVVAVSDSTLSGNSAAEGGALFNYFGATLTVTGSTIADNTASAVGGGIANSSPAYLFGGTLTVTNSTLYGNSATSQGGGIYSQGSSELSPSSYVGVAMVTNCTLTANQAGAGGGLYFNSLTYGSLTLNNTIVAGNLQTSGATSTANDLAGDTIAANDSLIGTTAGATIAGANNLLNVNPDLGPLADNGGPTQTAALLIGSPAVNAGSNALAVDANGNALTTDQRGMARILGGTVDIGAYEVVPVIAAGQTFTATEAAATGLVTVATFSDADPMVVAGDFIASIAWGDGQSSAGTISGSQAAGFTVSGGHTYAEDGTYTASVTISDANTSATAAGAATVSDPAVNATPSPTAAVAGFAASVNVATFTDPAGAEATADYSATIVWGDGHTSAGTISGPDGNGVFTVSGTNTYADVGSFTATVTIADDTAPTVAVSPTVTVTAPITLMVTNLNDSSGFTAGDGSLRGEIAAAVSGDEIEFAAGLTGVITLADGPLVLSQSINIVYSGSGLTVSGNNTSQVFVIDAAATATLSGLAIENGNAAGNGGGIDNSGALTLDQCTVINNVANGGGGGVYNTGALTISGSNLGSVSTNYGNVFPGTDANVSGGDGGSLDNVGGVVTAANTTFDSNFIGGNGGGIANENGGTVTLTGCDLSYEQSDGNGNGGGLYNASGGVVALTNCRVYFEQEGIYNAGTATITDMVLASSVTNLGSLTLTNSTTQDGIDNGPAATATLLNSFLDTAASTGFSGTLAGSALSVSGGNVTLANCTISEALDGVTVSGGSVTLTNVTVTGCGAGIDNTGGTVSLANTLVAGNATDVGGAATANYSLIGNTAGATIGGADNVLNQNPKLAPYPSLNGGGPTETFALLPGSPAIDAGSTALAVDPAGNPLMYDQRGAPFARVAGTSVDIGAFEYQDLHLVVSTTSDENDGNYSFGHLSLREALELIDVNTAGFDNTITFDPTVFATHQTITLTGGALQATDDVTITAPAAGVTVAGDNQGRVFDVRSNSPSGVQSSTVSLSGLTITGGGISSNGSLALTDCTLSGNTGAYAGGALENTGGTLTVTGCTFSGNSATYTGGAIENNTGVLTITGCTITGNASGPYGGGISNDAGTLNVSGSTIDDNSAPDGYDGGGIYNAAVATVTGCTLSGNTASHGGAIANDSGGRSLTLVDCAFSDNVAGYGGAIYTDVESNTTLDDCVLTGNQASGRGGALDDSGGVVTVNNSTFTANSSRYGGAIEAEFLCTLIVDGCTINGNTATEDGGGIANGTTYDPESGGFVTAINSTLYGNTAGNDGGGVFSAPYTFTLINCTVTANTANTANTASAGGGGAYFESLGYGSADQVEFNVNNTVVAGNFQGGGAAVANDLAGDAFTANYSLIGTTAGATIAGANNVLNVNPEIGPLANNGGPTETVALLAGSPAINAGSNALAVDANGNALTTDQRGLPRIEGGTVDIGAYEVVPVTAAGQAFTAAEGAATGLVTVVTFTDADLLVAAGDFTASIAWGDGQSSAGTISGSQAAGFTVSGGHTYAEEGTFTSSVTISNANTSATIAGTATVSDPSVRAAAVAISATAGAPATVNVATFTDPAGAEATTDYTATINWGDGQNSAGTISVANGVFTVSGTNTYAEPGTYTASVTITHDTSPAVAVSPTATVTSGSVSPAVTSFVVEKGLEERSYIRYLDLTFNEPVSNLTLDAAHVTLEHFGLDGKTFLGDIDLTNKIALVDHVMAIDFGAGGIGGDENLPALLAYWPKLILDDGYYKLLINPDGTGQHDIEEDFYRLFGDVIGNPTGGATTTGSTVSGNPIGEVTAADVAAISSAVGETGPLLNDDINGAGAVTPNDRLLAAKSVGRTLAAGLHIDD